MDLKVEVDLSYEEVCMKCYGVGVIYELEEVTEKSCTNCNGAGYAATADGLKLLEFLKNQGIMK